MHVDEHELERALRNARRRKWAILVAALVAIGVYPFVRIAAQWHHVDVDNAAAHQSDQREAATRTAVANRPLAGDELTRLRTIAPQLAATVAAFQREWSVATTPDALHAVTTNNRPCPIIVAAPSFEAGDHYVKTGERNPRELPLDFPRVMRGTAVPPPDFKAMRASADAIAQRVAGGSIARADLDAAEQLYAPEATVKFFVAIEDKPPSVASDDIYDSGRIYGTAYIYDLALGAVVCAAKVDALNSPGIKFDFVATGDSRLVAEDDALKRDLEVRMQRAIATSMRDALH